MIDLFETQPSPSPSPLSLLEDGKEGMTWSYPLEVKAGGCQRAEGERIEEMLGRSIRMTSY